MESTYISLIKFHIEKCSNQPLYSTSKVVTDCKTSFCVLFSSSLHSSKTDNRSENIFPCLFFFIYESWVKVFVKFWSFREKQCLSHGGTTRTRSKLCSSFSFRQLRSVFVLFLFSSPNQIIRQWVLTRSIKVSRFVKNKKM